MRLNILTVIGTMVATMTVAGAQIAPAPAVSTPVGPGTPQPKEARQPGDTPALPVPDGTPVNREEREGGLVVEDLRVGSGPDVNEKSHVVVHYHGTRTSNGAEFASTYSKGEPYAQQLPLAMQGWRVGLPGMKVGGIRRLRIPAAMAYGEAGQVRQSDKAVLVGPNEDVVFTVEVLDAIVIEDTKVGDGEPVAGRFVAVGPFTIKDMSGVVLEEATREKPFIWVHGEYQPMDLALEGMRVGGIRKITVPAQFALAKGLGLGHPTRQKVVIEFELLHYRCIDIKK